MASSVQQDQVCYKCVNDAYLAGQIKRTGASTTCSLCNTSRKCISMSNLVSRVEKILSDYVEEGGYFRRWSDGLEYCQQGCSLDWWVGEIFGCDNVEPVVDAVCSRLSSYSNDTNYSKRPYRLDGIGHQWGEFQEGMKHGNRFFNDSAKTFLDWIFKDLDKYSVSSGEHAVIRLLTPDDAPPIYRARTCVKSSSIDEIMTDPARNLAAPPKELASDGRMNPIGVPAFYGAFERGTCIAELRPPVGGTVVSGQFRLNRTVRVLDFGRFETADLGPSPSFFDPKYHAKTGRQEFLKYLHNEITVPVLPGSERDYLITQVIAEYLATHCKPKIDGVIFKSVQQSAGSNVVLFSHVACPPSSMTWRTIGGGYGVRGAKQSEGACIEYVSGSLVCHSISQVSYQSDEMVLKDTVPITKPMAHKAADHADF